MTESASRIDDGGTNAGNLAPAIDPGDERHPQRRRCSWPCRRKRLSWRTSPSPRPPWWWMATSCRPWRRARPSPSCWPARCRGWRRRMLFGRDAAGTTVYPAGAAMARHSPQLSRKSRQLRREGGRVCSSRLSVREIFKPTCPPLGFHPRPILMRRAMGRRIRSHIPAATNRRRSAPTVRHFGFRAPCPTSRRPDDSRQCQHTEPLRHGTAPVRGQAQAPPRPDPEPRYGEPAAAEARPPTTSIRALLPTKTGQRHHQAALGGGIDRRLLVLESGGAAEDLTVEQIKTAIASPPSPFRT